METQGGSNSEPMRTGPKLRMIERKGFQKLETYNGSVGQFDTWAYKLKGFMHTEPGFRPLMEWIEHAAMQEENELGQRPMTLLGNRKPNPGADPWLPGTEGLDFEDQIPEALGKLMLTPGGGG